MNNKKLKLKKKSACESLCRCHLPGEPEVGWPGTKADGEQAVARMSAESMPMVRPERSQGFGLKTASSMLDLSLREKHELFCVGLE
jgi:hypothetical protein